MKARPVQLQINQTGAWRSALNFDACQVPDELLQAADTMARLSGTHVGLRIVMCIPNESGAMVPTRDVLKHWTRETGWVNT